MLFRFQTGSGEGNIIVSECLVFYAAFMQTSANHGDEHEKDDKMNMKMEYNKHPGYARLYTLSET